MKEDIIHDKHGVKYSVIITVNESSKNMLIQSTQQI
jgi:hypothetical protein